MKYDYNDKLNNIKGFYEWNKSHFLINKDNSRFKKMQKFKKENGFYPDECWNLTDSICMFLLPRLKHFRNKTIGCPACINSLEEWQQILDKMIWSFEHCFIEELDTVPEDFLKQYNNNYEKASDAYYLKIHEGIDLFAKYFVNLWW